MNNYNFNFNASVEFGSTNDNLLNALMGLPDPDPAPEVRDPLTVLDEIVEDYFAGGCLDGNGCTCSEAVVEAENALAYFEHLQDQVEALREFHSALRSLIGLGQALTNGSEGMAGWLQCAQAIESDLGRIIDAEPGEV